MLSRWYRFIVGIKIILGMIAIVMSFFLWYTDKNDFQVSSIVFVLDVSHSMNVADMVGDGTTDRRLNVAKNMIHATIKNNEEQSYGLIIFSQNSLYHIPATQDHELFLTHLNALTTNILPQGGSSIQKALDMAANIDPYAKLILLTDGGVINSLSYDHTNPLSIVGVGSLGGGEVQYPDGQLIIDTQTQKPATSKRNDVALQKLAETAGADLLLTEKTNTTIPSSMIPEGNRDSDQYRPAIILAFLAIIVI